MNEKHDSVRPQPFVAIAVFAWNEEATLRGLLSSLLEQSLFHELASRDLRAQVVCMLNGCTDGTAVAAESFFKQAETQHPCAEWFQWEVVDLERRGKLNAWNEFVHHASASSAEYLFMMDADILIQNRDTLWNMLRALIQDPEAVVSVDLPCKDLAFKSRRTLREKLSMNAADLTRSAPAQLCAQLYCIRSEAARNIYLPKDLPACEDGFIKALVCTDFLAHPANPRRIVRPRDAAHTFEAYTNLPALLKNQKRQVIGQTVVHILVDQYLRDLPEPERQQLGAHLRSRDAAETDWLRRLIAEHLNRTKFFWRVCPTYVTTGLKRWRALQGSQKFLTAPATAAGFLLALIGSYLAFRTLKSGCTDYWPRAERQVGTPRRGVPASAADPAGARRDPPPQTGRFGEMSLPSVSTQTEHSQ